MNTESRIELESAELPALLPMAAIDQRGVSAELRTNLVRILAIALFYAAHAWNYFSAPTTPTRTKTELVQSNSVSAVDSAMASTGFEAEKWQFLFVTLACLAWLMLAYGIHSILGSGSQVWRRWMRKLSFVTTFGDVFFLTMILAVTSGARSPMVVGYFLILMLNGLRFDLTLVRWATGASILGYLFLLGLARWPSGLFQKFSEGTIPRTHQLMVLLSFITAGIIMGQVVRHAVWLASERAPDLAANSPSHDLVEGDRNG